MRAFLSFILFYLLSSNTFAKRKVVTIDMDSGAHNQPWSRVYDSDELNIKALIFELQKSKTGKNLLLKAKEKAANYGNTLLDIIQIGNGSLTDTTLIRRFSVSEPEAITYETRSKVFINKNLNHYDALLDLAHELTHFVYRKNFNPYLNNFTLDEFIQSTIEGNGGEVQAFLNECVVLKEIFPSQIDDRYNCRQIIDPVTGKVSKKVATEKFYHVGQFYEAFTKKLDKHNIKDKFPNVSKEKAVFISSAYGMPYPMAAYQEYVTVLNKVCSNDKKRLSYLSKKNINRSPASSIEKIQLSYEKRCTNLHLFN